MAFVLIELLRMRDARDIRELQSGEEGRRSSCVGGLWEVGRGRKESFWTMGDGQWALTAHWAEINVEGEKGLQASQPTPTDSGSRSDTATNRCETT